MSHPDQAPSSRPSRVALFASCMADLAAPGPARATVEVLEAMGTSVEMPAAQSCCGQPALNSGFPTEARMLARHWIETFEPYEAVVSPSGSCVAHVHHQLPRILGGPWAARARDMAARTWELSQFLARWGGDLRLRLDTGVKVTLHDSCHMLRSLGERHSAREVLGRVEGLELVEMDDPEICCGFGGTFAAKFPEVSVAMADSKLEQSRRTGADWLVAGDPGCLMHLQSRADWLGSGARTRHLAEVLRDALVGGGR